MSKQLKKSKIAIIGSGPAGATAAIYAARANMEVDMYLGSQPGGQLTTTTVIENFPGFIDGIQGPELMSNMQKQAQRFGAQTLSQEVKNIKIEKNSGENIFKIETKAGEASYDAIIVASGAKAKWLGLDGEEKYVGNGYHSCATCDGFFYRNKIIAVVGGGDSAMEEANHLTHFGSKVYLIHRRDSFRASKIMQDRVLNNPKVEVIYNSEVVSLLGEDFLDKIRLHNLVDDTFQELAVDGLFVAIGHIPNTDFAVDVLDMDELGYLRPVDGMMTNVAGIFTCGDVDDTKYRQAITAAGEGCKAAMDCEKWLSLK
jgi:thioredoxin reductase (NADPH)